MTCSTAPPLPRVVPVPDNSPYIVAAYAITWLAVIVYGLRLRRTRAEAERRLANARQSAGGAA